MADQEGGEIQCGADLFHNVPEECVASIIALTSPTPTDACRLALVSRGFLAASEANFVWERFLPSDCDLIVARSDGGEALLTEFRNNKKQLYLRLSDRPLLVDGASKSFWVEKSSGKKCWMIAARSLGIAWRDTPVYWRWTSIPESRFPEVAELISVWWFDVNGRIETSTLTPGTQYAAYLVFKLTDDAYGLDAASIASVCIDGVEIETRPIFIGAEYEEFLAQMDPSSSRGDRRQRRLPEGCTVDQFPKVRDDRWREVKIGEFLTEPGPGEGNEVELAVREVRRLDGKSGLIVQGIEVRPA